MNENHTQSREQDPNKSSEWQLGRTLGKGSAARVRLAKHAATGKTAAIKIIPRVPAGKLENQIFPLANESEDGSTIPFTKDQIKRDIQREITILKLMRHPNIIRLNSVSENPEEVFVLTLGYRGVRKFANIIRHLVCEYAEGGELFDYISYNGALPEQEAVSMFRQIIAAVGFGHRMNICHRDLKPENILLDSDRNIKLIDYGMAAFQPASDWFTKHCGSPYYAAPELVSCQKYRGDKSDVWSCGVILYALLTGYLPFDGGNLGHTLLLIRKGDFVIPSDMSHEAAALVSEMLQKLPEDRISIPGIMSHPLLIKYKGPQSMMTDHHIDNLPDFSLEDYGKAVSSCHEIDIDILNETLNLCENLEEEALIERLMCIE